MGNGASIKPARAGANLFESDSLRRAAKMLSANEDHHMKFAEFLQDGMWLDKVGLLSSIQSSQYDVATPGENFLSGYLLPVTLTEKDIAEMRNINADLKDPSTSLQNTSERTVNIFEDSASIESGEFGDTEHKDSASSPRLSKKQILKILISVACPLFEEHQLKVAVCGTRSGMCFMGSDGQCCCAVPCVEPVLTSEAMQTQSLFLSAAAHYSHHRIVSMLITTSWIQDVKRTFDNHALGIFICNAHLNTKTIFPILYANTAFENISGYSAIDLIGMSFQKQYGPATEEESILHIQTALQSQLSTRVVFTSYRKDGSTYVSTLALKPVFNKAGECCYVIGVMCDISRHDARLQELEHVDTVLALLPLVVAP